VTGDVRLIRSPISVAGMVLTTISAVVFLVVFLADLFGLHTNPYLGLVFFVVVPALFIAGLLLIPLGAWIERRRRAAGKPPSAMHWPRVDLNDPRQRRITVLVFALTLANIVIVSLAAYGGVEYMDSVAFCTQVCHPMKPQLRAHRPQDLQAVLVADRVDAVEAEEDEVEAALDRAQVTGVADLDRHVRVVAEQLARPLHHRRRVIHTDVAPHERRPAARSVAS